jgi:hypothetical protein
MYIYIYLWVLLVQVRVVLCLGLSVAWVTYRYSQLVIIIITNLITKIGERKMVTRQGYGMDIGGCNRLCPTTTGHSLVALFSLFVSIKNCSLHGPWSSYRLIILSTYLLMGAGRLITLLCGFRLFPDRLIGGGDRWRSKHHIEVGPQVWGLGVQVWTGNWNPW